MNTLELTITTTILGCPAQIEVEVLVDNDEIDFDILNATLVHLLPCQPFSVETVTPDFTACKYLGIPLDATEVLTCYRDEIEDGIPLAIREASQAEEDERREASEFSFLEAR
jgi:hypothetical protein